MPRSFAGLDFGTTNSTLALCEPGGEARLLPVEGDDLTIPSALFFSFEDGQTYFGRAAVFEYRDGAEGRFMRALKSILGSSLMRETTPIGRERMSFEALIGRFLRHLRSSLEADSEESDVDLDTVVLGRPVRFVDEDDAADRAAQDQLEAAARAQGFRQIAFQYEPVAAALHFEASVTAEQLALVVDIGGGTSDFSILRLSRQSSSRNRARRFDRTDDVLATSGVHVGGTDFDRLLNIASVMPHFGLGSSTVDGKRFMPVWYFNDMATWHRINTLYTPKVMRDIAGLEREAAEPEMLRRFGHVLANRSGHRLAGAVEAAKITLSRAERAEIALFEPGLNLALPVTRQEFEAATGELQSKISKALDATLKLAGVPVSTIETVILTGGGALVPVVREAITARFTAAKIAETDEFGSVGLGLAVDAAARFA